MLTSDGHERQAYELTGPPWTFAQLGAVLTRVMGLPIELREVPPEELGAMAFLFTLMCEGFFERVTPHLAQLIGRRPIDLEQYVRNVLAAKSMSSGMSTRRGA